VRGDHVLLAPPYIVSAEEIDAIVERLGEAVDAAIDAVGQCAITATVKGLPAGWSR
jgi:hypothetical protein